MNVFRASSIRAAAVLVAGAAACAALDGPAYAHSHGHKQLDCRVGAGNAVYPFITNAGANTIPAGARVQYNVTLPGKIKPEPTQSFFLKAPLPPKNVVQANKSYPGHSSCTAWRAAGPQIKPEALKNLPGFIVPQRRRSGSQSDQDATRSLPGFSLPARRQ